MDAITAGLSTASRLSLDFIAPVALSAGPSHLFQNLNSQKIKTLPKNPSR